LTSPEYVGTYSNSTTMAAHHRATMFRHPLRMIASMGDLLQSTFADTPSAVHAPAWRERELPVSQKARCPWLIPLVPTRR